MSHKPRSRYQRMQLAVELAAVLNRNATSEFVKEIAAAFNWF